MGISAASLLISGILAAGCATQHVDPRLGVNLPDVGLLIGVGPVDGGEWMIGASVAQNQICSTLFVARARQSTNCSGRGAAGRNDLVVSISNGRPNLVTGLTDDSIVWVEATGGARAMTAPAVSLDALGLPGGAFGFFVPDGPPLGEIRFVDRAGTVVERQTLPGITVEPGVGP